MKSPHWFLIFILSAVIGVASGYFVTLAVRPGLLPPALRWGGLTSPVNVLFLGTDVVYGANGAGVQADPASFKGRSDTILLARLDPVSNTIAVLAIPRDTQVEISGYGIQKINAANAFGGPQLAEAVVGSICGVPIDHYVVLNVHGLVELVNELGGITIDVPKPMHYMDWTAKLKIDLDPGMHTLTGNQAMGFVRFRHDGLGDIGRVQRQQIFLRAVMDKAIDPRSWPHLPALLAIAKNYVLTDMGEDEILRVANFARSVPKQNQHLVMLPGKFSGSGDWLVDETDMKVVVSRMLGGDWQQGDNKAIRVSVENASSTPDLGRKMAKFLRARGYEVISITDANSKQLGAPQAPSSSQTKIIAQRANPDDALKVKTDLGDHGQIVNASIGDIDSAVTVIAGDDVVSMVDSPQQSP